MANTKQNIFDEHLHTNSANYTALSPLSFLRRAADVYPDRLAIVHGERRLSWGQVYERCVKICLLYTSPSPRDS